MRAIDTQTLTQNWGINAPGVPRDLVMMPDGSRLLVTVEGPTGAAELTVIDVGPSGPTITASVLLPGVINFFTPVATDGIWAYVGIAGPDQVVVLDVSRPLPEVVSTIPVAALVRNVALTPDGRQLLVSLNDSTVAAIDTASGGLLATVALGAPANGLVVHPAGTEAYLSHPTLGAVTVLSLPTNQPPTAKAGPDQPAVECGGTKAGCAAVALDGTGSTDPDPGDMLTYTWSGFPGGGTLDGASRTPILPLGTHVLTLTVDDGHGGTDTVTVKVVDTTPPDVTAELVPVDVKKKHGTFEVRFSCDDACDGSLDTATARLNDVAVTNGQVARLEVKKPKRPKSDSKSDSDSGSNSGSSKSRSGKSGGRGLTIRGQSFELVVTCEDEAGNVGSATARPEFTASKSKDSSSSKRKI